MYVMKGVVKVVKDTIQISEKFSKREFVVTDNGGLYPQDVLFQLTKDKCLLGDSLSVGDEIEVRFNLNGKEWTNANGEVKYFNSLDAWSVSKSGSAVKDTQGKGFEPKPMEAPVNDTNVVEDDLPF